MRADWILSKARHTQGHKVARGGGGTRTIAQAAQLERAHEPALGTKASQGRTAIASSALAISVSMLSRSSFSSITLPADRTSGHCAARSTIQEAASRVYANRPGDNFTLTARDVR
jgi:hypothetical protein